MEISDNDFVTVATPSAPHSEHFRNTAVTVQNPISIAMNGDVSIFDNLISDYRIGIHGLNIAEMGIGFNHFDGSVAGNQILYDIGSFPLVNYHGGIWLQNCPEARLSGNYIANTAFNEDENFRGIDIENSLSCDLNCNEITNFV